VAILQYANDTIICLKHDINGARNLKPISVWVDGRT
jgi:hypothetical protein